MAFEDNDPNGVACVFRHCVYKFCDVIEAQGRQWTQPEKAATDDLARGVLDMIQLFAPTSFESVDDVYDACYRYGSEILHALPEDVKNRVLGHIGTDPSNARQ